MVFMMARHWKSAAAVGAAAVGVVVSGASGAAAADALFPPPGTADRHGGCHYEMRVADASVSRLHVRFVCGGEGPLRLGAHRRIPFAFMRGLRPGPGGTMMMLDRSAIFTGSGGLTRGAYTIDLSALATAVGDPSVGRRFGGSYVTSISSLLIFPGAPETPLSIEFSAPDGVGVATPFARRDGVHWLRAGDVAEAGFMVLGRFTSRLVSAPGVRALAPGAATRRVANATLQVVILDAPFHTPLGAFTGWVSNSAAQVSRYFRGFPAQRAMLIVQPVAGVNRVMHGVVISGGGPTILLRVGAETTREKLYEDWVLVHELVHIGSPYLGRSGRWLNEGIAVYVQTLVHVRAGWLDESRAWASYMYQMPRGLPALSSDGLSSARGIGGVYWGGALFMLLADIDIRRRTGGRKTLGDCLRGVLWTGADSTSRWTPEQMLAACDAAVGTGTMRRLASRHVAKGSPLHLGNLWRDLGLERNFRGVRYVPAAPLAAIRRAIMRARPGAP